MKRIFLPILILGSSIVLAGILINAPTQVEESTPVVQSVTVRVAEVGLESVQLTVESQGKVQAAQLASLSASVAGPVAWVSPALEVGSYVEQGQVLLRLENSDFDIALERNRATRQLALAEADHASNELLRLEDLADQRLVSDSQLQDAKRNAEVAAARLADAKASLGQAELDLIRTVIKAPFNAIIETREIELGQYVNRAQSVAVLYGADEVEVRVPLAIRQDRYITPSLKEIGVSDN